MRQPPRLLSILAIVPLAACASPREEYPSLAVRDIERASGTMEVEPAPPPPPPSPAPATIEQLGELVAEARAAHAQFMAAAPEARSIASAASNADPGTDRWARAQVAVADLEARRSRAMIALADLDRLYVNAATEAVQIEVIEDTRSEIATMIAEQNAVIESLLEMLAS